MKIVFVLMVTMILAACSSAPTTLSYYLLDGAQTYTDINQHTTPNHTILLKKLELASYLQSPNLPLLEHDHQVRYANHSAWAEPIEQGIKRALINDINSLSPNRLVLESMPTSDQHDYQLQLSINHFAATESGQVILIGSYWISQENKVSYERDFNLKQTLKKDGFNQSVIQQRQLLKQLATLIINEFKHDEN